MTSPEQRFWGKVERGPRCWLWTARVDRDGYGAFSVSRSTIVRAHRLSWELHRGEVPPTACVLHLCGERRCVNPEHLYLGSAHDCDRSPRPSPPPPRARRVRRRVPRGDSHWTHRQAGKIRRGARSHLSKLTADQVREIRALHARNLPIKDLAARYGVIPESISNIVRHRTWRDVGPAPAPLDSAAAALGVQERG